MAVAPALGRSLIRFQARERLLILMALGPQIGGQDPRGKTWMRCEMFRLISRLQDLGQKPQQNIGNYWVLYVMKHPTIHWVSLSCSFDKGVANLYPLSKLSTYTAGVEFIVPTPWSRIPRWRLLDNERRWRVATKALGWSLRAYGNTGNDDCTLTFCASKALDNSPLEFCLSCGGEFIPFSRMPGTIFCIPDVISHNVVHFLLLPWSIGSQVRLMDWDNSEASTSRALHDSWNRKLCKGMASQVWKRHFNPCLAVKDRCFILL